MKMKCPHSALGRRNFCAPSSLGQVIGAHGWILELLSQYWSSSSQYMHIVNKHLNTIGGVLWIFSGFKNVTSAWMHWFRKRKVLGELCLHELPLRPSSVSEIYCEYYYCHGSFHRFTILSCQGHTCASCVRRAHISCSEGCRAETLPPIHSVRYSWASITCSWYPLFSPEVLKYDTAHADALAEAETLLSDSNVESVIIDYYLDLAARVYFVRQVRTCMYNNHSYVKQVLQDRRSCS